MRYIKGSLAILALLAILTFSIQNLESIDVSFLSWSLKIPKFIVIVATYILGMITGAWLFDFLKHLFRQSKPKTSG